MGGDEFCILGREGARSARAVAALARDALTEAGDGFEITASTGIVRVPEEAREAPAALREADIRLYADKNTKRSSAARQACDALLMLLEQKNVDLGQNLTDVGRMASGVARRLGLSDAEVEEVRIAAELRDVGKAAIPDRILSKQGRLNSDEWAFMRQHTLIGERIVAAAPSLRGAAKLVRASHERVDGRGYPDGLEGDDIPLGAQIVAVSDAYFAMTRGRPYSVAMTTEEAVEELQRCADTQFSRVVVDAAVLLLLEGDIGSVTPVMPHVPAGVAAPVPGDDSLGGVRAVS